MCCQWEYPVFSFQIRKLSKKKDFVKVLVLSYFTSKMGGVASLKNKLSSDQFPSPSDILYPGSHWDYPLAPSHL